MFLRRFIVSFIKARTHDCPGVAFHIFPMMISESDGASVQDLNRESMQGECRERLAMYQRARVNEIADLGSWY
jgi:hypothetical protein